MSGFTTNPSLFKAVGASDYLAHAKHLVGLTTKCISVDGPEAVWDLGPHVWRKTTALPTNWDDERKWNYTAICTERQLWGVGGWETIASVFAGRIMDAGHDPIPIIRYAKQHTTAQVLWASVREPYNIVQAERAGCDIVTVPPVILTKFLDWNGKPLEVVAQETIAQFERDSAW